MCSTIQDKHTISIERMTSIETLRDLSQHSPQDLFWDTTYGFCPWCTCALHLPQLVQLGLHNAHRTHLPAATLCQKHEAASIMYAQGLCACEIVHGKQIRKHCDRTLAARRRVQKENDCNAW